MQSTQELFKTRIDNRKKCKYPNMKNETFKIDFIIIIIIIITLFSSSFLNNISSVHKKN